MESESARAVPLHRGFKATLRPSDASLRIKETTPAVLTVPLVVPEAVPVTSRP